MLKTKTEKDPILEQIINDGKITKSYKNKLRSVGNKFGEYTGKTITELRKHHTYKEAQNIIKEWEIELSKTLSIPSQRTYITMIKTIIKKAYHGNQNHKTFTNKDIVQDQKFQTFLIQKQNIRKKTKKAYITALTNFCNHTGKTLTELINEQIDEQKTIIRNNTIIEYNPSNGTLNDIIISWYIKLQKTHTPKSIRSYQTELRSFLKTFQIQLPPKINLDTPTPKWSVLTKNMIKNAIDYGTIQDKALYTFMASTGIRSVDIRNFTIGDFMEATKEYHQSVTVDDFIYNAPKDMMGYWEFYPVKTSKRKIECKVFNSPESSNYILQYLKFRKSKLNLKNEKHNTNYTLNRKHPLFAPYKLNTNEKYTDVGFQYGFQKTNLAIKDIERNTIKNKFDKGEIDEETYEDMLRNIPIFTPHQLRRYATSVFANKGINLRVSALFEGHKSPILTDDSYVQLDKETLRSNYYKCLDELSFEPTEVKVLTSEEKKKFDKDYNDLVVEIKRIKNMITMEDVNLKKGKEGDLFDF